MKAELEVAIKDQKMSKTEMRELLQSNLEEVDKLTTLSKTLLQLSKWIMPAWRLGEVNLGTIVSEVAQSATTKCSAYQATITVRAIDHSC